jgi:hypothetical protein
MSMIWFRALQKYQYAMRVDEDVCIMRLTPDMLATALASDYSFGLETHESHLETLETFGPWMRTFMASAGSKPNIPPLPTERMFFTNFFVSRVSWWEAEEVRHFLDAVNATGNTYRHRWGDAPIQTAALRLHGVPERLSHINVSYVHISTMNRIINGEEVAFSASGLSNTHFRMLAEMAMTNRTSVANASNISEVDGTSPTVDGPPHIGEDGCSDVPGAFSAISLCTGGLSAPGVWEPPQACWEAWPMHARPVSTTLLRLLSVPVVPSFGHRQSSARLLRTLCASKRVSRSGSLSQAA